MPRAVKHILLIVYVAATVYFDLRLLRNSRNSLRALVFRGMRRQLWLISPGPGCFRRVGGQMPLTAACLLDRSRGKKSPSATPENYLAITFHPIPKYERLQRMAERYPSLDPDSILTNCIVQSISEEVAAAKKEMLARDGLSEGRLHVLALFLERRPQPLSHSELAYLMDSAIWNITSLWTGEVVVDAM
mgnify:CR=1 FL=1